MIHSLIIQLGRDVVKNRLGLILICAVWAGVWCGCEVRRYDDLQRGARGSAIQREPVVRVRVTEAVDRVRIDASDRVRIGPVLAGDSKSQQRSFATPVTIHRVSDTFVVESADQRPIRWALPALLIESQRSGIVRVGGVSYPDQVVLHPVKGVGAIEDRFDVINYVPIEKYLPGVLERELFPHWHPTTYEAQAIAARSYAIDRSARHRDRHFDLESTVASQVYGGVADNPTAVEAVRRTRGVVLIYKDHVLPAYYSSCSGGLGQDAWAAFPDGPHIEPLRGRRQGPIGAASPNYNWGPIERDSDALAQRLARWGSANSHHVAGIRGVRGIQVSGRNSAGRPVGFRVIDATGQTFDLPAESFRFATNYDVPGLAAVPPERQVKSSFLRAEVNANTVRFYGQGWGHGVGMCQWGAQGMAIRGRSADQILAFYYPTTQLIKAY